MNKTPMKIHIGQRVKVKSLSWYLKNKVGGTVNTPASFVRGMEEWCGQYLIVSEITQSTPEYTMFQVKRTDPNFCGAHSYTWDTDMIENNSKMLIPETEEDAKILHASFQ